MSLFCRTKALTDDKIPKIFISYRRSEITIPLRYKNDLKALGYNVWLDQHDIAIGQEWPAELAKALHECDILIAFISPEWLKSPHCKSEFETAVQDNKKILPVMIHAIPDEELSKTMLGGYQYINLTGPAAAVEAARKKLFEQLPTPPNVIRQQHQAAARRKCGLLLTGVAIIAAVLAVLGISLYNRPYQPDIEPLLTAIITDKMVSALTLSPDQNELWFTTAEGEEDKLYKIPVQPEDSTPPEPELLNANLDFGIIADIEADCAGNLWIVYDKTQIAILPANTLATNESAIPLDLTKQAFMPDDSRLWQPVDIAIYCAEGTSHVWIGYQNLAYITYDATLPTPADLVPAHVWEHAFRNLEESDQITAVALVDDTVWLAGNDEGYVAFLPAVWQPDAQEGIRSANIYDSDRVNAIAAVPDGTLWITGLTSFMNIATTEAGIQTIAAHVIHDRQTFNVMTAQDSFILGGTQCAYEAQGCRALWVLPLHRNGVPVSTNSVGQDIFEFVSEQATHRTWIASSDGLYLFTSDL